MTTTKFIEIEAAVESAVASALGSAVSSTQADFRAFTPNANVPLVVAQNYAAVCAAFALDENSPLELFSIRSAEVRQVLREVRQLLNVFTDERNGVLRWAPASLLMDKASAEERIKELQKIIKRGRFKRAEVLEQTYPEIINAADAAAEELAKLLRADWLDAAILPDNGVIENLSRGLSRLERSVSKLVDCRTDIQSTDFKTLAVTNALERCDIALSRSTQDPTWTESCVTASVTLAETIASVQDSPSPFGLFMYPSVTISPIASSVLASSIQLIPQNPKLGGTAATFAVSTIGDDIIALNQFGSNEDSKWFVEPSVALTTMRVQALVGKGNVISSVIFSANMNPYVPSSVRTTVLAYSASSLFVPYDRITIGVPDLPEGTVVRVGDPITGIRVKLGTNEAGANAARYQIQETRSADNLSVLDDSVVEDYIGQVAVTLGQMEGLVFPTGSLGLPENAYDVEVSTVSVPSVYDSFEFPTSVQITDISGFTISTSSNFGESLADPEWTLFAKILIRGQSGVVIRVPFSDPNRLGMAFAFKKLVVNDEIWTPVSVLPHEDGYLVSPPPTSAPSGYFDVFTLTHARTDLLSVSSGSAKIGDILVNEDNSPVTVVAAAGGVIKTSNSISSGTYKRISWVNIGDRFVSPNFVGEITGFGPEGILVRKISSAATPGIVTGSFHSPADLYTTVFSLQTVAGEQVSTYGLTAFVEQMFGNSIGSNFSGELWSVSRGSTTLQTIILSDRVVAVPELSALVTDVVNASIVCKVNGASDLVSIGNVEVLRTIDNEVKTGLLLNQATVTDIASGRKVRVSVPTPLEENQTYSSISVANGSTRVVTGPVTKNGADWFALTALAEYRLGRRELLRGFVLTELIDDLRRAKANLGVGTSPKVSGFTSITIDPDRTSATASFDDLERLLLGADLVITDFDTEIPIRVKSVTRVDETTIRVFTAIRFPEVLSVNTPLVCEAKRTVISSAWSEVVQALEYCDVLESYVDLIPAATTKYLNFAASQLANSAFPAAAIPLETGDIAAIAAPFSRQWNRSDDIDNLEALVQSLYRSRSSPLNP